MFNIYLPYKIFMQTKFKHILYNVENLYYWFVSEVSFF